MRSSRFRRLGAALILASIVSGCGKQTIVNEVKLVQAVGFDASEEGAATAVLIPRYKKDGEADVELLRTDSVSHFDMIPKLNTKSDGPLEYGQLGLALFGERFAKEGIGSVLESFCKDPKIATRMMMAVTEGEAVETMEKARRHRESTYLSDMAKQNVRSGNLPSTNMHLLLFNFFGGGRDMYMPYFRVRGDEPTIDGTALFRGDRMAGHIGYKESIFLKLLVENGRNASILIPVKEATKGRESYVAIQILRSKAEYEVKRLRPVPSIAIRVELEGVMRKTPAGIDLASTEELEKLERESATYIERELEALLAYCKERRTDPVGLGDRFRSRDRRWNEREFQERYPTLSTQVSVTLNIFQTGVGE